MSKIFVFTLYCVLLCGCSSVNISNVKEESESLIEIETTVEQTRYVYEEPSLETNDVFDETYAVIDSLYSETESYVSRYPDYDLPDIEGYEKDAYGNYIITEQMFADKFLPVNEDGVIEYISYFDENGIMVNPMPTYYNNYLQYFAVDGG